MASLRLVLVVQRTFATLAEKHMLHHIVTEFHHYNNIIALTLKPYLTLLVIGQREKANYGGGSQLRHGQCQNCRIL